MDTPNHEGSTWSENPVQRLRDMLAAGCTGPQIAASLSDEFGRAYTPDAVTSKMRKLGLTTGRGQNWRADLARAWRVRPPRPLPLEEFRYVPPQGPAPALIDRPGAACAWPAGDWLEEGAASTRCCGASREPGRPYCREHTRIAYIPNKTRAA